MLRGFQMTFVDALIASGYVFDDENFDECYVKHDPDECVFHCYQQHEEDGLWNYVKMTDGLFDVITEVTFDPNVNTIKEGF
jgi:hypothetical protein